MDDCNRIIGFTLGIPFAGSDSSMDDCNLASFPHGPQTLFRFLMDDCNVEQ